MFVVYPVAAYRDLCPCRDKIKYVFKCILWLQIGICVHAGMRLSMFVSVSCGCV